MSGKGGLLEQGIDNFRKVMKSLMEKLDWVVGNLNRYRGQVA